MKNLFLVFSLIMIFIANLEANDYKIWKLVNSNKTVIFPMNNVQSDVVWIIQKIGNNTSESLETMNITNLQFSQTALILQSGTNQTIFQLNGNSYGIIKIADQNFVNDLRTMTATNKDNIIDDVNAKADCLKNGSSTKECKCAGGEGATACECGGSIASLSWHESDSCGSGYFACCPGFSPPTTESAENIGK